MYLKDIAEDLHRICCCAGSTTKKDMLENLFLGNNSGVICSLLKYVYDDSITYGVKTLDNSIVGSIQERGKGILISSLFKLLEGLTGKTSISNRDKEDIFEVVRHAETAFEQEFFEKIFKRNLNLGLSVKSINDVYTSIYPNDVLIKTFDIMLAQKFNEKKLTFPCQVEPKFDGIRAFIVCKGYGGVTIYSRKGNNLNSKFPEIVAQIESIQTYTGTSFSFYGKVLDCELIAVNGTFQQLMTRMGNKLPDIPVPVKLMIFDSFSVKEWEDREVNEQLNKRQRVSGIFSLFNLPIKHFPSLIGIVKSKVVNSIDELMQHYTYCVSQGYEGVVIKKFSSYEFKRSYNWMKLKPIEEMDLEVIGIEEGEGKFAGKVGALLVNHKGTEVSIGSGISTRLRGEWFINPEKIIGKSIEIRYQSITLDNSLLFNRFYRIKENI